MSNPTTAVDESTSHEETPPPEMHEALALVQRIGGRDLLTKVIGLFRTTSEQRLGAMRAAVAGDERQQLSRLAHAMKGSAAQVGAESLRAVSAALEKEAVGLGPADLSARIDVMTIEVTNAWGQLEAYGRIEGGIA
ncbi:MAG: Hpt domain-containing protein [Gemmatimonadetes bacterium]|nr:Hpt domain-containing protein [Gemmatimonadota bacterium]